jgi:hypothetical protein
MGLFRFLRNDTSADRIAGVERQCQQILGEVKALNDRLAEVTRRESQLRAVLQRNAELDVQQDSLDAVLSRTDTAAHVAAAVSRAGLRDDPFPHAVIDDVLPLDLYRCVIRGIPPVEVFSDRPVNKQQLTVPFSLAPNYSQHVWRFLTSVVIPDMIEPAVVGKFRGALDGWIAQNWPDVPPASVQLHSSDGRIILRSRGYRIPPHRDPKWGFITCILYLARKNDSEAWGTQLYSVDEDQEARGPSPHWIDPARCRPAGDVTFKPNRMLVFLNSVGAHGASIPDDAPENLERYIYQFRIAPTVESMALLKATLPEERRPFWAGKGGDY